MTQELPVDPLIHWCVEPTIVGNKPKWEVDRTSGPWTMHDKLVELGIEADRGEVEACLKAVMDEILLRKRSLTDEEIRHLAMEIKAALAGTT